MHTRFLLLLVAVSLLVLPGGGYSQATPAPQEASAEPASSKLVVPAETTIPLVLKNTINSRTAHVGQAVYCETIFPITVGNRIVIPVGTAVKGAITQVVRPGRVKGRAQIGIRFETIILANGATRPLRAALSGFAGTGNEGFRPAESKIEGASSKGEDAGKVAQTTMTGAEIGTITGAVKGTPGKGLAMGSLAGAAGGLIWILASRGKEIILPSGTNLELQLSVPLSFERDELEPPIRYPEGPAIPRRDPGPGA